LTKGIDPKTGRPIPNPAAEYAKRATLLFPANSGRIAGSRCPMTHKPT